MKHCFGGLKFILFTLNALIAQLSMLTMFVDVMCEPLFNVKHTRAVGALLRKFVRMRCRVFLQIRRSVVTGSTHKAFIGAIGHAVLLDVSS